MEKQPAEQGLKTRGLAVGNRVPMARASTRPITAPANHVDLVLPQDSLQAAEGLCLGDGLNHLHHLSMQELGFSRETTTQQSLMQFPYGVAQPSQLEGAKVSTGWSRL